jgi:integrase
MGRKPTRLIPDPPTGLRERMRKDGSVRLWWEPPAEARAKGMKPVELDARQLTRAVREAERLNREAARPMRKRTIGITVGYAIDDYFASRDFIRLRPVTQRTYREKLAVIRDKWGASLIAEFDKPTMKTWYDASYAARGPYMARSLIIAFSIVFSHAEIRGWRPEGSNPCLRLKMEVPKGRRRIADWAQFDMLLTTADRIGLASVGDAVALSTLTGQRQTDVIEARRELFREVRMPMPGGAEDLCLWIWQLTRSKRGNESAIPLHPEALARIRARLAAVTEGPLLVDERSGLAYTPDRFRDRWEEVREAAIEAGGSVLRGLQFRDLRRTFGRMSRAGGASKADVGDVLGNSAAVNQHLGDIYMAPEIASLFRAVGAVQRPEPKKRKMG